jgi:hypothetical protein
MQKIIKILTYTFIMICVITSLSALSFKNKVFADTLQICCNDAICESSYYQCTTNSSANIYYPDSGCIEISITCGMCVNYTLSRCICGLGRGSAYCWNGSTKYYGELIACPSASSPIRK